MQRIFRIQTLLLLSFLFSCSNVKYAPSSKAITDKTKIDTVMFLTPKMKAPDNALLLGNWEQVEDWNFNWKHLMYKLKSKAVSAGANLIKIEKYNIGDKTKGHGVLLSGKFYSIDIAKSSSDLQNNNDTISNCKCSYVHIFRDEGNAGLRTFFKMDLVVNDSLIGPLPNKKTYTIRLIKEGDVKIGTSKLSAVLFNIEFGKEYYVQGTQDMDASKTANSFGIMVGAKTFALVDSNLQIKTLFETLEMNNK